MTDAAPGSAKPTKDTPWAIKMLHALAADRVRQRLGADAFVLAIVLIEKLDGIPSKRIGQYMSQLAEPCGDSVQNPRRTRLARTALIDDGWLIAELPKHGERSQGFYQMVLKATPTKTVAGIQASPSENGLGDEVDTNQNGSVTPTKSVVSHQPNPTVHTNQNGSPSVPILSTPILPDPILSDPKPPTPLGKGECEPSEDIFELIHRKGKASQGQIVIESASGKPKPLAISAQAEAIYQAYPRHTGRGDAIKKISAALKTVSYEHLLERVTAFAAAVSEWPEADRQYIPYPATWINRRQWEDDPSEWERKGKTDLFHGIKSWLNQREPGPGQLFDEATAEARYAEPF